jgi:S-adenosylmethionine:tRNA ribosyltransferase-isomerase
MLCASPDGVLQDRWVLEFPQQLEPGDIVVFNDTRVIPARLFGTKGTGGRVEILVERVLDPQHVLAQVRASKPPRRGGRIRVQDSEAELEVLGREDQFYRLRLAGGDVMALLEKAGHVPLPPYIQREDEAADRSRYQTVFARQPGAAAAPTAGLHFDQPLLEALAARGVATAYTTLHVGAGTFQPVRVEDLSRHHMHAERLRVDAALCQAVARARAGGGRVVAVGTTVVRALETAAADGALQPFEGETRLFITPGYRFRVVDALLTNFHLPESTLLMLVCAFGGYDQVMAAYRHAVAQRYRFFSYGDAMWLPAARVAARRPTAQPM